MAISSDELRRQFLAQILNQGAPRSAAEGISSLGTSLAAVIASRRQIPAAQKREADLKATETADKIGEEVRLRDALVGLGLDPGQAGSIAGLPSGSRGAVLGRIPTAAETAKVTAEAEQTAFDRENTLFNQGVATERLGISQQQANTAGRRADIAASEAARGKPQQIDTVRMKDGSVRSFRRDDPLLDQALRQGGVRFNANVDAADTAALGGATTASQTRAQQTIDSSEATLGTIQQLREVLRPENVGLSGDIRGLGIGALGQLESFSAWVDGKTQAIIDQAIESGDTLDLSLITDPDLSAQRLLENVLTYQYSKAISPGDRVTDQDFRQNFKALGFGKKLTSVGDLFARLATAEKTIIDRRDIAKRRLGVTSHQGEVTSPGSKVTRKIIFDAQGQEVVQ